MNLAIVTVAINYDDYLAITLPAMVAIAQQVIVVTSPGDPAVALCLQQPSVTCIQSNRMKAGGFDFNKAALQNDGIAAITLEDPWLLLADPDVLLPGELAAEKEKAISGNLYSCQRLVYPTPVLFVRDQGEIQASQHFGYFLLFDLQDPASNHALMNETQANGVYDINFRNQWPPENRLWLDPYVKHLGPTGQNWTSRQSPRWEAGVI